MKELRAEMTRGKEEDKRALRSDIEHLTRLVKDLTTQSPKRKAVDLPRVTFKQEVDSDNEPPSRLRASKKIKVSKQYKTGMRWDNN